MALLCRAPCMQSSPSLPCHCIPATPHSTAMMRRRRQVQRIVALLALALSAQVAARSADNYLVERIEATPLTAGILSAQPGPSTTLLDRIGHFISSIFSIDESSGMGGDGGLFGGDGSSIAWGGSTLEVVVSSSGAFVTARPCSVLISLPPRKRKRLTSPGPQLSAPVSPPMTVSKAACCPSATFTTPSTSLGRSQFGSKTMGAHTAVDRDGRTRTLRMMVAANPSNQARLCRSKGQQSRPRTGSR